jgi:hypothetical protein
MANKVLDFRQIDLEKVVYSKPEKIKGSYVCNITYNGDDIYVQTPLMNTFNEIEEIDSRTYLELVFNEDNKPFYNFLNKFDEFNIMKIHKNSQEWFNKEFPLDIVEDFYSGSLKHKNNPKLKLKFNKNDTCFIYDKNEKAINKIKKNSDVICLLKFNGFKFLSQQVISEWIPIQIKTNYEFDSDEIKQKYMISGDIYNTKKNNSPEVLEEEAKVETELTEQNNIEENENVDSEDEFDNYNSDQIIDKEEFDDFEKENNLQDISNLYLENESQTDILFETQQELERYKMLVKEKSEELNKIKDTIKNVIN